MTPTQKQALKLVVVLAGVALVAAIISRVVSSKSPSPAEAARKALPDERLGASPGGVLDWTSTSVDEKFVVRQEARPDVPGGCQVECTARGGAVLWKAALCVGKSSDYRFVSSDGLRLVVVHPLPDATQGWRGAQIAHVYDNGTLNFPVNAAAVLRDDKRVHVEGRALYWLKGAREGNPLPPRYAADGSAVEFETSEGSLERIPLQP